MAQLQWFRRVEQSNHSSLRIPSAKSFSLCYNLDEGKSPLGKPRASPVSLASGEPTLFERLSLFGFGLSELGKMKSGIIHPW